MIENASAEPQDPVGIPAATVIIFRRGTGGSDPELMMVRRAAHMRFAASATVFPGGRVDPGDWTLAARLLPHLNPVDGASRVAAIRETLEETGLLVGVRQSVTAADAVRARAMLLQEQALAPVLEHFAWQLAAERLVPFARWCPDFEPAFDTRFYLTDLGTGAVSVAVDGTENDQLFWASAAHTLQQVEARQRTAIFPTLRNLERLAGYRSFAEAEAHARAFPPQLIRPWKETVDGIEYLRIQDDAGYAVIREPVRSALRS